MTARAADKSGNRNVEPHDERRLTRRLHHIFVPGAVGFAAILVGISLALWLRLGDRLFVETLLAGIANCF